MMVFSFLIFHICLCVNDNFICNTGGGHSVSAAAIWMLTLPTNWIYAIHSQLFDIKLASLDFQFS